MQVVLHRTQSTTDPRLSESQGILTALRKTQGKKSQGRMEPRALIPTVTPRKFTARGKPGVNFQRVKLILYQAIGHRFV